MKTKTIIEQDKKAIEAEVQPFERKAWLLSLLLQRMEETGYPVITPDIDAVLITGTDDKIVHRKISSVLAIGAENYIRTTIIEGSQLELAGGVRLSKSALFEAVEVPDLSQVKSVEQTLKEYHRTPIDSLAFVDGRFIVPDEVKLNAIEKHTSYAHNDKHAKLFNDAKKLVAEINRFHSNWGPGSAEERSRHALGNFDAVLTYNPALNRYEVDTRMILHRLLHLVE